MKGKINSKAIQGVLNSTSNNSNANATNQVVDKVGEHLKKLASKAPGNTIRAKKSTSGGGAIHDESLVEGLIKMLSELSRTHVEIGIIGEGDKYKGSNITVLGVATVHEFGVNVIDKNGNKINIPERSFIRSSYDANKEKIFDLDKEFERVLNLELSVDTFFNLVGEFSVGIIQNHLTSQVNSPPLAESTIKAKGSSNPLIDTGQLRSSITYKIVRR